MVMHETLGDLLSNCTVLCKIKVNDIYKSTPLYEGLAGNVPTPLRERRLLHYIYYTDRIIADTALDAYRYFFAKAGDRGDITVSLIAEDVDEARDILADTVKDADEFSLEQTLDVIEE